MMLRVLVLAGAKARVPLLWCNGGFCGLVPDGVFGFPYVLGFCGCVFYFFFLFHVLGSFLYTSSMLRDTFTLFINLSTYL